MEFRVDFAGPVPGAQRLEALLAADDPSAIGDLDPGAGVWRVNAMLSSQDLVALLAAAGCATDQARVALLPSVCCGGCSG